MKFIKENKLAVLSISVIVLSAIFLALPGQFATYHYSPYAASGYEFFFNTITHEYNSVKLGNGIIGSGIAILILFVFGIASICLGKKSSFFVLLASIFNLVPAILFFCMENQAKSHYPAYVFEGKPICGWVTYVCGALLILVALYLGYKAVRMMINEVKHPSAPKGPSYNYLKK